MKKKLGLGSGIAVCVGLIVATSCLVSLGTGMGAIGRWFIIPMFLVMILNWFIAISFAELNRIMPNVNGGTGQYLLAGMGPLPSLIGNMSAYVITEILSLTAEITLCGTVLKQLFFPNIDNRIISLIVLVVFFVINLCGIDMFAKIQNLVVTLLIGSMICIGIIGALKLGNNANLVDYAATAPTFAEIGGISGICNMAALAFWLFIGVEFIIPVAKDMKNPKRDVLLSMTLGLLLLFVVQSILGSGFTNYVSLDALTNDPDGMPHMTYATNLLGTFGRYWMGIITILAAASTVNTVYASISKILQGMGEEGMVPKAFAKTNKRGAAWVGLTMLFVFIVALIVSNLGATEGVTFLLLSGSCFWLFTYCLVHASVLILRKKNPDAPRDKRLVLGGIPQIIGILGNVYMIWNIDSGDTRIKIFKLCGILFTILIVYSVVWVCGIMKVSPFKTVPIEVINDDSVKFDEYAKSEQEENGGLYEAN